MTLYRKNFNSSEENITDNFKDYILQFYYNNK